MAKKEKEKQLGGQLGDYPNDKYAKFFGKFDEIETLDVSGWKAVHILSYFCKKYKEHYNVNYTFKFNSPNPNNCFEVFQIKRIGLQLSAHPKIIRDYIDWVYETKVVQAKRRLTSISFLAHEGVIADYKKILMSGQPDADVVRSTVDRSMALPQKYREVFKNAGINVANYGELAFLSQMEQTAEITAAFEQAAAIGFDKAVLDRVV